MKSLLFVLLVTTTGLAQPKLPSFVSHVEVESADCPSDEPCLYYEDSAYVMRKKGVKGSWIVDVGLPNLPILSDIKTNGELFDRATSAMSQLAKQLKAPTVKVYCGSVKWLSLPLRQNAAGAIVVDVPAGAPDKTKPRPLSPAAVNELIAKRRQKLGMPPSPPYFDDASQHEMVKPGVGTAPYVTVRAGRLPLGAGKYDLRLWLLYSREHKEVFVLDRSRSGDAAAWASDEETAKRDAADGPALVQWLRAAGIQRVTLPPSDLCNAKALLGEWLTWTVDQKQP